MRNDEKQKQQERIVKQLLLIREDFNWFVIAGRLLKSFAVEEILNGIGCLNTKGILKIRKLTDNTHRLIAYLIAVIDKNNKRIICDELEQKAETQKRIDMEALIAFQKEWEKRCNT